MPRRKPKPRPKPPPAPHVLMQTLELLAEERRLLASERKAVEEQLSQHRAELVALRKKTAADAAYIERLITERDEAVMALKDGTDLKQLKRDAEDQEKRLCGLRDLFDHQLGHVLRDMRRHIYG